MVSAPGSERPEVLQPPPRPQEGLRHDRQARLPQSGAGHLPHHLRRGSHPAGPAGSRAGVPPKPPPHRRTQVRHQALRPRHFLRTTQTIPHPGRNGQARHRTVQTQLAKPEEPRQLVHAPHKLCNQQRK